MCRLPRWVCTKFLIISLIICDAMGPRWRIANVQEHSHYLLMRGPLHSVNETVHGISSTSSRSKTILAVTKLILTPWINPKVNRQRILNPLALWSQQTYRSRRTLIWDIQTRIPKDHAQLSYLTPFWESTQLQATTFDLSIWILGTILWAYFSISIRMQSYSRAFPDYIIWLHVYRILRIWILFH